MRAFSNPPTRPLFPLTLDYPRSLLILRDIKPPSGLLRAFRAAMRAPHHS
jgi:hypothetical protein